MSPIPVIYENGVFRPTVPVVLPEATPGSVTVSNGAASDAPQGCPGELLHDILMRSYDTGETDLAARVDEIDP